MTLTLEKLKLNIIPNEESWIPRSLENRLNKSNDIKACDRTLKSISQKLGDYYLIVGRPVSEIKKMYHVSSLMHEYFFKTYAENWLPLSTLMKLSLSDHNEILQRLCKMRKIEYYQDQNGQLGYLNAFYNILEGDWEGLKDTIVYLKNIRGDYSDFFYPEVHFVIFEGFINKDQSAIEYGLNELLQDKYHKKRIADSIEEKFIAFEVLAYAKQAWKYGIEVWKYGDKINPDSPYIPAAMLPYEPLPEYTIPYKFLYEFYQQQGVNWRYDPVYPELQGENPKKGKGGFFGGLFGKKSS